MSHDLHVYLAQQLDKMLRKDRVAVFYDPRSEFIPFVAELEIVGEGLGGLPRVCVDDTLCHLARYESSFFGLRTAVEPVIGADKPEPIIIYISGIERDRSGSVLMELEKGGTCYEPKLRSVARFVLRQKFTDGEIDELLGSNSLTYQDVVDFLGQADSGSGSLLKLVLGGGSSESLVSKWLASDENDAGLEDKNAQGELYKLVGSRLGLDVDADTPLAKARHLVARYVLINEFRADLTTVAPDCLEVVPSPSNKEDQQRIEGVAQDLRAKSANAYIELADSIEKEFGLASTDVDPSALGSIDTFRFEERRLLDYAAQIIAEGDTEKAQAVIAGRGRSFWLENSFLDRLAQWEACRFLADLSARVAEAQAKVAGMAGTSSDWVKAYAAEDGWYRVDRAQRSLESWVAQMEDDPEDSLDQAIKVVRKSCEELLELMSTGFTDALVASEWATPEVLHQTQVYSDIVESRGGRTAYIFVDAMRYEMGVDLTEQLTGAEDLVIQPAVCALPSITPVGMAALHPGAAGSFSVVAHKNGLAAQIGPDVLPNITKRKSHMKAIRPDSYDVTLDDVLHKSTSSLKRSVSDAKLIVVRSQDIDAIGESIGSHMARQAMDTAVGNVARAVRKLAKIGIENFVITSDHGHLFSSKKSEDMIMDKPGGEAVELHRRCWAGQGGQTAGAAVRVSGAQLGYQCDLDFIFPRGLAVFRSGGDLAYHHGGVSLQEMVIPVVSLRMPVDVPEETGASKVSVEGYPKVLTNRTFGFRLVCEPDMFEQGAIPMRVVLLEGGEEVGRAGMAMDVEFDRGTATVRLAPGEKASIGMMLNKDTSKKVRIVVQDPATDAILAQSDEIEIGDLI